MPTDIKLKNSVTATNAPTSLQQGEVAINITDKKVWVGNAATTPVLLLGSGADGTFTNLTVSGVASFADGTVSLPSITNIGDTNTGIYFPAADTIAFTEGGVESMRIDSAGNLGVGTSSPNAAARATILSSGTSTSAFGNVALRLSSNGSGYASTLVFSDEVANSAGISMVSGNLAFGTSGFNTERMRIDSSGNVGIGNTVASTINTENNAGNLVVGAGNTTEGITIYSGTTSIGSLAFADGTTTTTTYAGYLSYFHASDAMTFGTGATERMRIDSSGNVGIGITPTVRLNVHNASSIGEIARFSSAQSTGEIQLNLGFTINNQLSMFYNIANGDGGLSTNVGSSNLIFRTVGTERMRIDSSGNLLVNGTTVRNSGRMTLDYAGSSANGITINDTTSTNGSAFLSFFTGGTSRGSVSNNNNTGVLYNVTSDYRLKTVIGSVTNAGQRIDALEPIEYDWNTGGRTRGFLAHQFAEVYPNSVSGEKDAVNKDGKPIYQAMQSSSTEVMADLIAEIQSLRKRVAQLESK